MKNGKREKPLICGSSRMGHHFMESIYRIIYFNHSFHGFHWCGNFMMLQNGCNLNWLQPFLILFGVSAERHWLLYRPTGRNDPRKQAVRFRRLYPEEFFWESHFTFHRHSRIAQYGSGRIDPCRKQHGSALPHRCPSCRYRLRPAWPRRPLSPSGRVLAAHRRGGLH